MLNFFLYTHCPLLDFCHDASSPLFFRNQLLVCNVMHAIIVGKFVSKNFRDCWFYCTEYFKLRRIKRKFVCLNIISMALNMTHIPFPSMISENLVCSLTYWKYFPWPNQFIYSKMYQCSFQLLFISVFLIGMVPQHTLEKQNP